MHHKKMRFILAIMLLAASLAFAAQTHDLPFGPWTRASNEPILSPQGATWESAGTFNPAVVLHDGKIVMLYRAQDASGTSRLGYAFLRVSMLPVRLRIWTCRRSGCIPSRGS